MRWTTWREMDLACIGRHDIASNFTREMSVLNASDEVAGNIYQAYH
jgi:hypothetical protein